MSYTANGAAIAAICIACGMTGSAKAGSISDAQCDSIAAFTKELLTAHLGSSTSLLRVAQLNMKYSALNFNSESEILEEMLEEYSEALSESKEMDASVVAGGVKSLKEACPNSF